MRRRALSRQVEIAHGFGSSRSRRQRVRWRLLDVMILLGVTLAMTGTVFLGARLVEWIIGSMR